MLSLDAKMQAALVAQCSQQFHIYHIPLKHISAIMLFLWFVHVMQLAIEVHIFNFCTAKLLQRFEKYAVDLFI